MFTRQKMKNNNITIEELLEHVILNDNRVNITKQTIILIRIQA